MTNRPRTHKPLDLLRYAGLFTWVCAGMPLLMVKVLFPEPLSSVNYVAWWIMHLLFGIAYWNLVRLLPQKTSFFHRLVSLLLMTASAIAVSTVTGTSLGGILLLIIAGILPWVLSLQRGLIWLVGQNIVFGVVSYRIFDTSLTDIALELSLFFGVSLFAYVMSLVGLLQLQARDEVRKINSELRATQALLAENTRIAERVRIARELHDLVGHHLTALTLNLEVTTHLIEGKALEHVQQAHSLAKLLLADVREVVGNMRENDKVDLEAALRTLIEGVPQPKIHLQVASDLALRDPNRAQIILRCAQEMITNSVRHAQAENLWIHLRQGVQGMTISARDDGRGVADWRAGNGLKGMTERIKQLGGRLEIESAPGAGFTLHAWIPEEMQYD